MYISHLIRLIAKDIFLYLNDNSVNLTYVMNTYIVASTKLFTVINT
jgi:hypothetical protein